VGNLQVFLGPEKLNHYAAFLHSLGGLLWVARLTLLASLLAHASISIQLVMRSAQARPVGYRAKQNLATTYAAMTMRWGGPALLLFILFHLAHFTVPGVAMGNYVHSHTDVYSNVVNGFSVPWVTAIYVLAQLLLGMHLYHGAWSLFQTLGISHPRYNQHIKLIPKALGVGVAFGNIAMPLSVLAGIVH
jgi:succinate dehydrogenase / fumarate reductase cytochrome b subunit